MGKYEDDVRKAVGKFVKDRVEVSTLYQYKDGSSWKNANTKKDWSKTAKYRMVTKWRRRNVNIRHQNLYVTFQQGGKMTFYKDSSYSSKLPDFTVSMTDQGDRNWHNLVTVHFKMKGKYSNSKDVWGGYIGSTPQVSVAIPFAARKKDGQVHK